MYKMYFECRTTRALELAKSRIEERFPLLNVFWSSGAYAHEVGIADDYGEQTRGMFDILCEYIELFALEGWETAHVVLVDTSLSPLFGSTYDGRSLLDKWVNWRISDED